MKNWLAAFAAALTLSALATGSGLAGAQDADSALPEKIASYLNGLVESGFSGAVLVARDGEILLHEGYGLANDATLQPNSADTVFGFGSITKQFTAAAILQLEMQGMLNTEDSISRYFDAVPADKSGITIHQLLTHSSGLRSHVFEDDFLEITRDDAVRQILEQDLLFEPGTEVRYSDDAYKLLAAIVEIASDQSWQSYLESHLFRSAAMEDTGFFGDARWEKRRVANGYNSGQDQGSPADWPHPQWALIGAGGVMTTVEDMYRWYLALQDGEVLSDRALEAMWEPHERIGGRASYGYGWIIVETEDQGTFVETTGAGSSHNAYFHGTLDDDFVVIVASNRIDEPLLSKLGLTETDETFYAFQVGDALVENISSGSFNAMPEFTEPQARPLRPTTLGYTSVALIVIVLLIGGLVILRRR